MKGKRTINKSLDLLQRMRVPRLGQNIVWRLLGTGVYRRMEPSEFYKGLTHARTPTGYKTHRASTTNSVERSRLLRNKNRKIT